MSLPIKKDAAFAQLPAPWPEDPLPEIRKHLASSARKVVILDDDPTGTQTVRGITVVTCWDVPTLRGELAADSPGFFVLTNSRSLTDEATRTLHREIAANLIAAADGRPFTVISRSDSTLRGHYPAETDVLASVLGTPDLLVIAPYFEAGGRFTIGNEHYVAEGQILVPAAATPFAQDSAFGYKTSHLPGWVEEKTKGLIAAAAVSTISLELIRHGGPDAVEAALLGMPRGSVCVVNACTPRDIEVYAAAALRCELAGKSILYRTAASIVAARLGQAPRPPVDPAELVSQDVTDTGGIVVAGSYVPKTTAQLERLRSAHDLEAIELDVGTLLDVSHRENHLAAAVERANTTLCSGRDVLVFTSRKPVTGSNAAASLEIGHSVSDALIHLVRSLNVKPRFLIAKGGITSSDIATRGLAVKRATIVGQILPGVPVWRLGAEARFPDMAYVVFPGNVGDENAVADAVSRLKGKAGSASSSGPAAP